MLLDYLDNLPLNLVEEVGYLGQYLCYSKYQFKTQIWAASCEEDLLAYSLFGLDSIDIGQSGKDKTEYRKALNKELGKK